MPTYDFKFSPLFAGQSAVVTDSTGAEVDGSPVTLDAAGAGSLVLSGSTAPYRAKASNVKAGLENSTTEVTLNDVASFEAGGGGGTAVTDGVGSVFFGGESLVIPLDNTRAFTPFIATDDPPRAPQRDDLFLIDPEDDTTLNVMRSGLYDICINVPLRLDGITPNVNGNSNIRGKVDFEVNGGSQPPAYNFNNVTFWTVSEDNPTEWGLTHTVSLTFPQVLLEGDTVQLAFRAMQGGNEVAAGTMVMNPDITFLLTYRGPVELEA